MSKIVFIILLLTSGLIGCASVPMESPEKDAEMKLFKKPVDNAGLYIYRNETMGGGVKMDLKLDGKLIGESASETYFYQEVAPGKHEITSEAENTSTLTIDAMAGKLYYIWQEVKMGFLYARSKLQLVSEEEGQAGVKESKLAVSK